MISTLDGLPALGAAVLFLAGPGWSRPEPAATTREAKSFPLLAATLLVAWTALLIAVAVLFPETAGSLSEVGQ